MGMLQNEREALNLECDCEHQHDLNLLMSSVALLLGIRFVCLLNLHEMDSNISSSLTKTLYMYIQLMAAKLTTLGR